MQRAPTEAAPTTTRNTNFRAPSAMGLLATAVVIAGLYFGQEVLIPLALALLLSGMLGPMVRRLERWRIPRVLSVIVVLLGAFGVIGISGWLVYSQLGELIEELPKRQEQIRERVLTIRQHIEKSNAKLGELFETFDSLNDVVGPSRAGDSESSPRSPGEPSEGETPEARDETPLARGEPPAAGDEPPATQDEPPVARDEPPAARGEPPAAGDSRPAEAENPTPVEVVDARPSLLARLHSAIGPLLNPLGMAGAVAVFLVFILLQMDDLRNRFMRLVGQGRLTGATEVFNEAARRISRFLLTQTLLNGSYGVAAGLGLFFIGVPSWALWGFLCSALRFLPYIGPWIGAIPPIVLSFATAEGDSWWLGPVLTGGLFVCLELLFNFVFEPWLYGTSTGLTAFGVLVAAFFWTWVWGPIGLLLATPLTVCLVVGGKHFPQLSYLYLLLGDEESLSPPEQIYQRILANDSRGALELGRAALGEKPFGAAADEILAPVLLMAENDWDAGELRESSRDTLHECVWDLLGEAEKGDFDKAGAADDSKPRKRPNATTLPETSPPRVACLPARDEADALAAALLAQVLRRSGFVAEPLSEDLLVGEMIEQTETFGAAAACIVSLPGTSLRHARVLTKRLRAQLPALKVIFVVWSLERDAKPARERFAVAPADGIADGCAGTLKELERLGFHGVPSPQPETSEVALQA